MALEKAKKIAGVALLIACMLIAAIPGRVFGHKEFTIDGDVNGLVIKVPQKIIDTSNLNPGDRKKSSLELINNGSGKLKLYIRTNIIKESAPHGGRLADIMKLTIKDGGKTITDDVFREVAKKENIYIGEMAKGERKIIDFHAYFPEEEAGNEYMASTMEVSWTFVTQSFSGGGGGYESGGGGRTPTTIPANDADIDDEPVPLEPAEPEEPPEPVDEEPRDPEITVEDDEMPSGPPDMPKTGGIPPVYFIGSGLILVAIGIGLRKSFTK